MKQCDFGVMHSTMFQPPTVVDCSWKRENIRRYAVWDFPGGKFPVCKEHHEKVLQGMINSDIPEKEVHSMYEVVDE